MAPTRKIESTFLSADSNPRPWNARWLGEPSGVSVAEFNEISRQAADGLRAAIDSGEIVLSRAERCVCGTPLTDRLSAFDRFGMPFSTLICRACGVVRLDPFISETSLPAYYDRFYHPLHFGTSSHDDRAALFQTGQGERIWEIVEPYCAARRPLRILEIGAGTGSILQEIQAAATRSGQTVECLGTELSHDCIRVGAERRVDLIFGGFDEVISRGRRFDVVVLSHVFEHFTDLPAAARQLEQVLADEGIAYVEVPGIMALHDRPAYRFDYARYVTHAHVYHFNLTALASVLARNGFELLYGDEEVRTVFRPGRLTVDTSRNFHDITAYLRFLAHAGDQLRARHVERARLVRDVAAADARAAAARLTAEAEVAAIKSTVSWRLTRPLREAQRWLKKRRTR